VCWPTVNLPAEAEPTNVASVDPALVVHVVPLAMLAEEVGNRTLEPVSFHQKGRLFSSMPKVALPVLGAIAASPGPDQAKLAVILTGPGTLRLVPSQLSPETTSSPREPLAIIS